MSLTAVNVGEDAGLRMEEKGYRGARSYQLSSLSRPITTKQVLANPQPSAISDQFMWQFNIPRTNGLFWTAFSDGAQPYVEVTLTATRDDGTQNGFCRVEPFRMVSKAIHTINNNPVNSQDLYREIPASLDVLDEPFDYLQSEGSAFGVDINPSYSDTPYTSCTATKRAADRLDFLATQTVSGSTDTAIVPTASSTNSCFFNSVLRYGVPRRFRIPLKYFVSGVLSDPDSMIPLAALHRLELYLNRVQLWAWDVPYYPATPNTAAIANTASQVTITFSDVQLWYQTVNAFGWLAAESAALIEANQWMFRTIVDKTQTISVTYPSNGIPGAGTIQFGSWPYSVKSLECVLVSNDALNNPSIGSKMTFLDYGTTSYQWRINNNVLVPIFPAYCGYPTLTSTSNNNTDGFAYYTNFRRSKMSQNRNYGSLGSGSINKFMFDGDGHYNYNTTTYATKPLPGYYPSVLPIISGLTGEGGITGINDIKTNCVRSFRMVADLNSVSESDDFLSGVNAEQVYLDWRSNGLLGFYVTNTNPGVITYPTALQAYIRARCNAIIYMGASTCTVLDQSSALFSTKA